MDTTIIPHETVYVVRDKYNDTLTRFPVPYSTALTSKLRLCPFPLKKSPRAPREKAVPCIRERVIRARQIQAQRFANEPGIYSNAQMTPKLLHLYAQPDAAGLELLRNAMNRLNLSARAYDRILKVSRTIADLEGSNEIRPAHLAEAISYRNLDRENWAG